MSNNYRWKDRYYDVNNVEIDTRSYNYANILAIKGGTGRKNNPIYIKSEEYRANIILSSGSIPNVTTYTGLTTYGQRIGKTIIQKLNHSSYGAYLFDSTVESLTGTLLGNLFLIRCEINFEVLVGVTCKN